MKKFDIPKLILPLDLGGYNEEAKGQTVLIWVDPPLKMRKQYGEIELALQKEAMAGLEDEPKVDAAKPQMSWVDQVKAKFALLMKNKEKRLADQDGTDRRLLEWFSEIFSQGPADTHISAEQLHEYDQQNPALVGWLCSESLAMIRENQERKKKA